MQYIRPVHYSIFQPCIPAVATLISTFCGFERITLLKSGGIICAISGAVIAKYDPSSGDQDDSDSHHQEDVIFGTTLVIIQVSCMGLLLVLQKTLVSRYDSTVMTFSYYAVATIITIIVSAYVVVNESGGTSYTNLLVFGESKSPWMALLYAAFSTFYTNNAYSWAGKQVSPSVTSIYNTFQPVFTAVLSAVFLQDVLSEYEVYGGVMVILGMTLTLLGRQKEMQSDKDDKSY